MNTCDIKYALILPYLSLETNVFSYFHELKNIVIST